MGSIKIDLSKVNKAIFSAFDKTVDYQSEIFQQELEAEKWNWPRLTKRSNGSIAGTVRDIIDTGALADSQTVARSSDGMSAEFSWGADYAIYVHEGVTLRNGTELPARPWARVGIEEGKPDEKFASELRRLL